MRLADLHPQFRMIDDGNGPRRWLRFDCPLGHGHQIGVPVEGPGAWGMTGELPDTLSITPSIDASRREPQPSDSAYLVRACGWHGFVTDGEVR